jgi:hypothetical protein
MIFQTEALFLVFLHFYIDFKKFNFHLLSLFGAGRDK